MKPIVRLGDVVDINPHGAPNLKLTDNIAFVAMADVTEDGELRTSHVRTYGEVTAGYTPFQNGDVLLAKITPCFENGKSCLVSGMSPQYGFGSTEFHVLRAGSNIDTQFLHHLVRSSKFRHEGQRRMTGSAGQKRIPRAFIEDFHVSLPSKNEQRRIAAILDKANAIRKKRVEILKLTDEFLLSLFLDMFGDPVANPKGWPVSTLGNLALSSAYAVKAGPFGSSLKKEIYVSEGYKVYGQEQVIRNDLSYGNYYIDEGKFHELASCQIMAGDLLISLVGTFGKISVVPNVFEPGIINPRLMKISLDPSKALPYFAKAMLTTDAMLRKITSFSHGGTMGIVNLGIMKSLVVPVPPIAVQEKFEAILRQTKEMSVKQRVANDEANILFQSVQHRAFN